MQTYAYDINHIHFKYVVCIRTITVGTRGDWFPRTFRLRGATMYWFPNFLAVVYKKQEISQQILLLLSETQSFHIITPHSADIVVDIQPATVERLDIHVLGSPLISAQATRMQDSASEFSKKISGGDTPDHHRGRSDPLPHSSPALTPLWPGLSSVLGPNTWSPSTFQPWLRP